MRPPQVEGPTSTGRHRAVPAAPATPGRLAAFAAAPPRLLRWAMLGAALVILITVPLMNITGGSVPSGSATTADERDDAVPTARAPRSPAGSVGTPVSGSSAQTTE